MQHDDSVEVEDVQDLPQPVASAPPGGAVASPAAHHVEDPPQSARDVRSSSRSSDLGSRTRSQPQLDADGAPAHLPMSSGVCSEPANFPGLAHQSSRSALEEITLGHRKLFTTTGATARRSSDISSRGAVPPDAVPPPGAAAASASAPAGRSRGDEGGAASQHTPHQVAQPGPRLQARGPGEDGAASSIDFFASDEVPTTRRDSLEQILNDELGMGSSQNRRSSGGEASTSTSMSAGPERNSMWTMDGVVEIDEVLGARRETFWGTLFVSRWFTGVFMLLTLYALYAPDIDQLCGNKESEQSVRAATTVVCVLFLFELIVHHLGDETYILRAYFWLDLIALISLVPETLLLNFLPQSAAMQDQPGELARITRMVARSSKAARLNRLFRVVRVVALMPRLQRFIGRRVNDVDIDRLVNKKLTRIFYFLDEDLDGKIPPKLADRCIKNISKFLETRHDSSWIKAAEGLRHKAIQRLPTNATGTFSSRTPGEGWGDAASTRSGGPSRLSPTMGSTIRDEQSPTSPAELSQVTSPSRSPSPWATTTSGLRGSSSAAGGRMLKVHRQATVNTELAFYDVRTDQELLSFADFKLRVMADPLVQEVLVKVSKQDMEKGNNMQSVNARNSEYIGVKVALMILFLLFVLTMVDVVGTDTSAQWSLGAMDTWVRAQYPGAVEGSQVPPLVDQQVDLWMNHRTARGHDALQVLYLDLDKRVYCDELSTSPRSCSDGSDAERSWGRRGSLTGLGDRMEASGYRLGDMQILYSPDLSDQSLSMEEIELQTDAAAVLYVREDTEYAALISILQTSLVMVIILAGVITFSQEITFLSAQLLRPLVDLSDEMESMARLQLAGVRAETQDECDAKVSSEIRLIKSSFDNMKTAIRSWGKYVPWPVVQLLLRKEEADLSVGEQEVSIFFSDIASFTTIVEGLPPEKSLLLLSRYFHDMSKVIDAYEGIVLEYIGDAIMSVYGAPIPNVDHPAAAVKSALKMLSCLKVMNKWFTARGLPAISIRAGVHTGTVLVGNMGFASRMKYGVVGEEANVPGRLEELNKTYSSELMISQATYDRLPSNQFIARPLDFAYIMSGPGSQPVYEVLGRDSEGQRGLREACKLHSLAMESYRSQNFGTALHLFSEVNQKMADLGREDKPSAMFMDRCQEYLSKPPPHKWDGVWDGA